MIRKEFIITERQLKEICKQAEELQISKNESLRRILDMALRQRKEGNIME